MSFPIHITNIYELLNEDGEVAPRARIGAEENAAPPRTQVKGSNQNTASTKGNSQGNAKPQGSKDGARKPNESRPPRQENRPPRSIDGGKRSNEPQVGGGEFTDAPVRRERFDRTRGDSHRSNSDRRARAVDQVGEIGGKRVFDRRSGTGRGREQKKGGAGRGNWGKEGEGETPENWDNTEEGKDAAAPKKEGEKPVEEVPVEKDPVQEEQERLAREEQEKEDKMMTLDTYYKQKEASQVKIDLPQARKANEGVDQKELSKWNSYQVLKKEEDIVVSKKDDSHEKSGKNTVPLDQVFNIREAPKPRDERPFRRGGRGGSDGGSRGGRGGNGDGGSRGGRGGKGGNQAGGRGGSRGGRGGKRGEAPNFDLNSFPTLAPKA